jgi:hypothetical protein
VVKEFVEVKLMTGATLVARLFVIGVMAAVTGTDWTCSSVMTETFPVL